MKRKYLSLLLALVLAAGLLAGCGGDAGKTPETPAPSAETPAPASADPEPSAEPASEEPVTITIAGGWTDCRAIETVGRAFTEKYPNCTIVYEYLQDYYEALPKRMTGDEAVDIFFTVNIQEGSELLPYALDLNAQEGFDLSNTFDGLIQNFTFREEAAGAKKLYAIPVGAEMRGLYVNKTLLDSLNIAIPTDQASLLAACETLKQNGYIPFHGNPGDFSQILLYPWVCNLIVNAGDAAAVYERVNSREPGFSEIFREPMEFLYTLVENDYYNYKKAQTDLNLFNDTGDEFYARYFLSIAQNGEEWEKADDLGQIAFMPSTMSLLRTMEKTKDDYHSEIEYVFMPAPVGADGGFVYLSPAHGIAANSASENVEWSVKFLDFLFQPENNKIFAEEFNVIPNTKEAFDYIDALYDVPADHISELGQVTFDYGFYDAIVPALIDTSKANNPKYMQENADGSTSLYPFDYYMNILEESLQGNEEQG